MRVQLKPGQPRQPVTVVVTYGEAPKPKSFAISWRTALVVIASVAIAMPAVAGIVLGVAKDDFRLLEAFVSEAVKLLQVAVKVLTPAKP